ncbi:hypothetical protein ADK70_26980 [Streptomyces rimosus subsp. pseudoverticillatus]|uniref:hypothetical protein n=1 Tax=Streptomyces rimosus TaxID=1927 RepID=UPI0006B27CB9|nr:hypothetical protein [Streptomyces rimosus]KOT80903.1 hypothetical protein ADK70_26980 [Streptomyces rimosus subsp. pseudoverticillatus]
MAYMPIRWTVWDGNDWAPVQQISSQYVTSQVPALAAYPSDSSSGTQRLYCIYESQGELRCTSAKDPASDWDMERSSTSLKLNNGPGAIPYKPIGGDNELLHTVYSDPAASKAWATSSGLCSWSSPSPLTFGGEWSARIAMANYQGNLIVVQGSTKLAGQSYDGTDWKDLPGLNAHLAQGSPDLQVFDDELYCIRPLKNTRLCYTIFDGDGWSEDRDAIVATNPPTVPSLGLFEESTMMCVYTDDSSKYLMYTSTTDGKKWDQPAPIREGQSDQPKGWGTLLHYDGLLYCAYQPV